MVAYNYNFIQKPVEPFKKNDSLFTGKYWKFLKDLNFNYLPTNISVSSNIVRQYNEQKFREINLAQNLKPVPQLYQRNFLFDWQYTINYNLTRSLRFNFNASNNRIINNYITPELLDDGNVIYNVDNSIGIWDGFFDVGDPNQHFQSLQVNYDLPFDKFPFLKFIRATYSYQGDFQWQDGSDLLSNIPYPIGGDDPEFFDLGNSVQNASTHRINSNLDMNTFYRYVGLTKIKAGERGGSGANQGGGPGSGVRGIKERAGKGGGDEKGNEKL